MFQTEVLQVTAQRILSGYEKKVVVELQRVEHTRIDADRDRGRPFLDPVDGERRTGSALGRLRDGGVTPQPGETYLLKVSAKKRVIVRESGLSPVWIIN